MLTKFNIHPISRTEGMVKLAVLLGDPAKLRRTIADLVGLLRTELEQLGSGAQRTVFGYGDTEFACKLPLPSDSWHESVEAHVKANILEVWLYETDAFNDGTTMAPRQLLWHESGVPVVLMEYMDRMDEDAMPDWAFDIDGEQVGWSNQLDRPAVFDGGSLLSNHHNIGHEFEKVYDAWLAEARAQTEREREQCSADLLVEAEARDKAA